MIAFTCPSCGKGLKAREQAARKKSRCPQCGELVQVPEPAARPALASVGPGPGHSLPPGGTLAAPSLPPLPSSLAGSEDATVPPAGCGPNEQTAVEGEGRGGPSELTEFLAPSQAPDELGRLGPYRVLRVLGSGGMGVVYGAEDPQLKRPVALKALLPGLGASAAARQRFLREAQLAASLEHENIVPIYQVGEDRGVPFLAMQLLQGESLEARLRREGALPLGEVLRTGREAAEGLSAAHEKGLVHRDIKPANIWLEGQRGRVKLLDFGLARAVSEDARLTQSGAILGTPAYMAPEQAQGKPVDARTDLFSLGVVLYRLATGELPFKGSDTLSTLMAVSTEDPRPPQQLNPALPRRLADLILQLLGKDPGKRPASARAVVEALQALESDRTEVLPPPSAPGRAGRGPGPAKAASSQPAGRRLLLAAVAAGLLAVLAAGAGLYFFGRGRGPVPGDEGGQLPAQKDPGMPAAVGWAADALRPEKTIPPDELKAAAVAPLEPPEGLVALLGRKQVEGWGDVLCLAWSPDGRTLAVGTKGGTVQLQDVAGWKSAGALTGHKAAVQSLAFSADGRMLASGAEDGSVLVWDAADRKLQCSVPDGGLGKPRWVAFSPDGHTLATGDKLRLKPEEGQPLKFWDPQSGAEQRGFPEQLRLLAFSPDGRLAATATYQGGAGGGGGYGGAGLAIWDAHRRKVLHLVSGLSYYATSQMSFSPDSRLLAVRRLSPKPNLVNAQTGAATGPQLEGDVRGRRATFSFSPDSRVLAFGGDESFVRFWDLATGKEKGRVEVGTFRYDAREHRAAGSVVQVAYGPDGRHLATVNSNGTVYVLRLPAPLSGPKPQ